MYDFVGLNKIAHHSSSFQCKKAQLLKRFLISLYAILVQCNLMATITILLYVFPARTTFQLFQRRRNDLFLVIFTKKRNNFYLSQKVFRWPFNHLHINSYLSIQTYLFLQSHHLEKSVLMSYFNILHNAIVKKFPRIQGENALCFHQWRPCFPVMGLALKTTTETLLNPHLELAICS